MHLDLRAPIASAAAAGALLVALIAAGPAPASQTDRSPLADPRGFIADEVVIGLDDGTETVVELPAGVRPKAAIASLAGRRGVRFAHRNWVVSAADLPLDRGSSGQLGGWRSEQWNFLGRNGGVRVPRAWRRAERAGRPGGAGVTIAIADTGVAYLDAPPRYRMSPGFDSETAFSPGIDLVDGDDVPADEHGHGTHLAGTIAEQVTLGDPVPPGTDDYLTGIAHGATLMPVRILDSSGRGTSADLARGIRWAARNGADVINLSLELPGRVRRCRQARAVCRAIRLARRRGALVVAAAGNRSGGERPQVRFPALVRGVLAVGASTESGCLASYSHSGRRLDLLAPGGGVARRSAARRRCRGDRSWVRQVTLACPRRRCPPFDRFRIRAARGTSMAAAHASAVAALVRASGATGPKPGAGRLRKLLKCSARPLGRPRLHGAGILDAARATSPRPPRRCRR